MDVPVAHQEIERLKEQGLRAFRAGELEQAEEAFCQALELLEREGDRAGAAEMLANLGVVHIQTRQFDQAEEALSRALETFRALSLRSQEAQALGNLGTLKERAGQAEAAAQHYRQAAGIFEELGEQENLQATLGALAQLQLGQRKWLQSLFSYERMLASGQKLTLKQRIFRFLFRIMSRLMRL